MVLIAIGLKAITIDGLIDNRICSDGFDHGIGDGRLQRHRL